MSTHDHHITGGPKLRPNRFVDPPPKRPGKHRWVANAMYWLSPGFAAAMSSPRPERDVHLNLENLGFVGAGCIDCEESFPAPEPCRAGDEWQGPA